MPDGLSQDVGVEVLAPSPGAGIATRLSSSKEKTT